jgi:branched-chain amino acid transport system substrate-binding protein
MQVNRRKFGALLCVLLATAAVAGTAAASHSSKTPGVSAHQIVIGGTFPYSGPAQLYKTIPTAEQAYYKYVNAKGGVFHRKIKDITVNDEYNPAETVPAVKKLVEQDHVFAIVGSLGTAPGLATWGLPQQAPRPTGAPRHRRRVLGQLRPQGVPGRRVYVAQAVDDGLAAGLPG